MKQMKTGVLLNVPDATELFQPTLLSTQALGKTVSTAAGPLQILHDIDLSIAERERIAIVGPSGSGKSTLLALLAGLDVPSEGSVRVGETVISNWNEDQRAAWRARDVGFVFQQFQLLPSLTAIENVMLPLELAGIAGVGARQRSLRMLERVGLAARQTHYPRQLSGGEQQRVALARACIHQPRLLFADEPTGSLDEATGRDIADMLFAMNSEFGTTLILVTHDLELANRCQRQLHIHQGRLT
jgi:putative ABC transport system ATP-binding protein